jgi:uncharacterized cupin superfamily protein
MSLDMYQIAEAFCSWRFAETYPYMADDIKWNIVGRAELTGRAAVIDRCTDSAKFLATVSATLTKLKVIRAETCAIVEGAAHFQHQDNHISSVASCDVFQFSDERLVEITSYVVELNTP